MSLVIGMDFKQKLSVKVQAFVNSLLAMLCMIPCSANPITRFSRKLASDKKGNTGVLVAIVVVVVAAILIFVAAVIISKVDSAIDRSGLSEAANDTLDAAASGAYGALDLMTVVLVILGAVAIIGAVIGIFAYVKFRG